MKNFITNLAGKVSGFFKSKYGNVVFTAIAVALAVLIGCGCYNYRLSLNPKFHDVTIELGQPLPEISEFLTEYGNAAKAKLLTEKVYLNTVGIHELTFSHGSKVETVKLIIKDTTAPKVEFRDVEVSVRDTVTPEDFVVSVEEESSYTVYFADKMAALENHGNVQLQVVVSDIFGNLVVGDCQAVYRWLKPSFTLELGNRLHRGMLLYNVAEDKELLDQEELDRISASPVGEYTITSTVGDSENTCVITVRDTVAPELVVQDVTVYIGQTASLEDFVVSATDLSGEVTTRLAEPLPLEESGIYTVVVEAEDINGNVSTAEAQLRVVVDTDPPEFDGVYTLYVEKNSEPDYEYGVVAIDERDGYVHFTVDASRVDTSRAGTYYVVYTAIDSEGNEGTYRRRVDVRHDAADTAAMVSAIAARLSSDVEEIRDYVRNNIWYSYDWGGEDPVWFGFDEGNGNCYVHALCFQALLREKGIESQLIWVMDKTHYWNLVYLNGKWVHMDSTPGVRHERYSIMNDELRYETLSGRDWDRNQWPVCE